MEWKKEIYLKNIKSMEEKVHERERVKSFSLLMEKEGKSRKKKFMGDEEKLHNITPV